MPAQNTPPRDHRGGEGKPLAVQRGQRSTPPPPSTDYERLLLSTVLLDPKQVDVLRDTLSIFACQVHRDIARVLVDLVDETGDSPALVLANRLRDSGTEIDAAYIAYLANEPLARSRQAPLYARELHKRHVVRRIIDHADRGELDAVLGVLDEESRAAIGRTHQIESRSARDVMERDIPERPAILAGLLYRSEVAFVSGAGGLGKSWLLLHASLSIATGRPVFGAYDVPRPRRVAYLDLEGDRDGLDQRVQWLGRALDASPGDLCGFDLIDGGGITPGDPPDAARLLSWVEERDVELLVVDSFRRAFVGDENDSQATNRFFRVFLEPMKRAGVAVVLIDHIRKRSGDRTLDTAGEMLRGSGDKRNLADVHIGLERRDRKSPVDGDISLLWVPTKVRHARTSPPVPLVLTIDDESELAQVVRGEPLGTDGSADADVLGWLQAHPGEHRRDDVQRALGITRTIAVEALRRLVEAEEAERVGSGPATRYRARDGEAES